MSGSIQSSSTRSGRRSAMLRARRAAVLGLRDLEAGAAQAEGDHLADRLLVLDDQDRVSAMTQRVSCRSSLQNYDTAGLQRLCTTSSRR